MVSLCIHGMVKSFGHPTYGLQHLSTIDIDRSPINAHQLNNQLDFRSALPAELSTTDKRKETN